MIIGVDPGMSGAVVALDLNGEYVSHFFFRKAVVGKTNRLDIVDASINFGLLKASGVTRCFVEKVSAMPGQGVSSMFNFGYSAGATDACMACNGLPITHISPAAWKRKFGFVGLDKDAPRMKASLRFPNVPDLNKKGKGQAIADAIFVAYTGMEWNL